MANQPSKLTSFMHAFVSVALFAIPLALNSHAPILDMTVSGLLQWAYLHLIVL